MEAEKRTRKDPESDASGPEHLPHPNAVRSGGAHTTETEACIYEEAGRKKDETCQARCCFQGQVNKLFLLHP